MPEGFIWDPHAQTMPAHEIAALHADGLASTIAKVWEGPAAFFRRKLEAAGLGTGETLAPSDLASVPFTVKDELRRSEADSPPLGDYRGVALSECVRIGSTGGTSGAPTYSLWTRRDLAQDDEAAARMFWRQGLRPGMVISNAHPLGVYGGGRHLTGALENFGCLVLAVGAPATDADARAAVELWRRVTPVVYQLFPAAHVKFHEAALVLGLDPEKDLNLRPPAETPDMAYRTITAGSECFSFLGSAGPMCEAGGGAHMAEDWAIVEVTDAAGRPVPDGEIGEMVVTTIDRDLFLLRYNLEDLVRVNPEPCPCGETHRRIRWEGRKKDIVRVSDVEILPLPVTQALYADEELHTPTLEYQIVRHAENPVLHVRVERDADRFGASGAVPAARRAEAALADRFGVDARVDVVDRGTLPRPPYKPERVVDEP